jgi:hypothetical protein
VKVACSISGTWEASEVADVALVRMDDGHFVTFETNAAVTAALSACRDRWALVKALVLGKYTYNDSLVPETLHVQRNAVFAALADMARAEQDACSAQQALDGLLPASIQCRMGCLACNPAPRFARALYGSPPTSSTSLSGWR